MRRSEAENLIGRSDMRPADRLVFLRITHRADNETCEIPARFVPSLGKLSAETGLHLSTVARSLAHLELHRWIQRERSKGGRRRADGENHRTRYLVIACGTPLPCDCSKQSHSARVSASKRSHSASLNSRFGAAVSAAQPAYCTEGRSEGGSTVGDWPSRTAHGYPLDWQHWPVGSIGENENRDLHVGATDLEPAAA
jgi:hypothetical protein